MSEIGFKCVNSSVSDFKIRFLSYMVLSRRLHTLKSEDYGLER